MRRGEVTAERHLEWEVLWFVVFSFSDLPTVCGAPDKRQGLRVRPRIELPAPP